MVPHRNYEPGGIGANAEDRLRGRVWVHGIQSSSRGTTAAARPSFPGRAGSAARGVPAAWMPRYGRCLSAAGCGARHATSALVAPVPVRCTDRSVDRRRACTGVFLRERAAPRSCARRRDLPQLPVVRALRLAAMPLRRAARASPPLHENGRTEIELRRTLADCWAAMHSDDAAVDAALHYFRGRHDSESGYHSSPGFGRRLA